ncbi:unnamed protein product, partial [Polarella glacialis]
AVPSASSASRPPSLSRQPSFDTEMRGGAHGGHRGGVTDLFRTIRSYPSFSFQVLAFGTLGGVGFAVPGCNDAILERRGFSPRAVAWLDVAFIASGVLSGLILGSRCTNPAVYGKVLTVLFAAGAVSLTGLAFIVEASSAPHWLESIAVAGLIAVSGVSCIGFVGLGIEAAALYPAGGTTACFLIELIVQVTGASAAACRCCCKTI